MKLSEYHENYSKLKLSEIKRRVEVKASELEAVFGVVPLESGNIPIRIAVMGCADKRLVSFHKTIFEKQLKTPVEITTFDISIEHLQGEDRVIEHNCTEPLPLGPYDVTYSHVLLKFIGPDKQFDVLKNSFDALNPGGIAIHILDTEDLAPDGQVSLGYLREQLASKAIAYVDTPIQFGRALILKRPK